MIELRKKTPALIYGDFKDVDPQNPSIFAYTRTLGADKYLVVLNFTRDDVAYTLPPGLKAGQLELSNLGTKEEKVAILKLNGWEARVYRL
jgi:oligo-1,6-glucosidase